MISETAHTDPHRNLVFAGWISLVFFAPLAFVLSIILMAKGHLGHGIAIFVICVLLAAILVG